MGPDYDKAIERAHFILKMLNSLWEDYKLLIVTAESPSEAARLRKEAVGRMISLWRRYKRHLNVLIRVKEEILKTHVISEDLPIIVIAGIPSAGKSTLISALSTAKPEIASYPFTTKTIIVGKMQCHPLDVYLVDTPGILDRPYEELNEIERKAYVALKTLPHLLVYLFDVSPERVVDIEGQLRLFKQIRDNIVSLRGISIIPVINKIDVADYSALKEIKEALKREGVEAVEISAREGSNLGMLKKLLCEKAVGYYLKLAGQHPRG